MLEFHRITFFLRLSQLPQVIQCLVRCKKGIKVLKFDICVEGDLVHDLAGILLSYSGVFAKVNLF